MPGCTVGQGHISLEHHLVTCSSEGLISAAQRLSILADALPGNYKLTCMVCVGVVGLHRYVAW